MVLSKSTDYINQCRLFFSTLSGVCKFFSHSTTRTHALKQFMSKKIPSVSATRWNFSSRLVNTVHDYRSQLTEFFSSIENDPGNWKPDDITAAQGFIHFLSKLDTKFLLVLFNKVFFFSDVLFNILQNKHMDISYCTAKIDEFHDMLKNMRESGFEDILDEATTQEDGEEPLVSTRQADMTETSYRHLYYEILDTLIMQMKTRFESRKDLQFVSLLDSTNFGKFKNCFPENLVTSLKEPYSSLFDIIRLKNELKVFYSESDSDESAFENKPLEDICLYMKTHELDEVYSELYKLVKLVLTLPSTTAGVERSFSALKRINTYLRATQGQTRLSNLGILSIEKELLLEVKQLPNFYDVVTEKFAARNRRVDFIFK